MISAPAYVGEEEPHRFWPDTWPGTLAASQSDGRAKDYKSYVRVAC
jgi:hypothetical protein